MHKNNSKQFKSKHFDDVVKDFLSSAITGFFSIMPKNYSNIFQKYLIPENNCRTK